MKFSNSLPPVRRNLNVKVTQGEYEALTVYCLQQGRTKTDLIREMIRRLPIMTESDGETPSDILKAYEEQCEKE